MEVGGDVKFTVSVVKSRLLAIPIVVSSLWLLLPCVIRNNIMGSAQSEPFATNDQAYNRKQESEFNPWHMRTRGNYGTQSVVLLSTC